MDLFWILVMAFFFFIGIVIATIGSGVINETPVPTLVSFVLMIVCLILISYYDEVFAV